MEGAPSRGMTRPFTTETAERATVTIEVKLNMTMEWYGEKEYYFDASE